MISSLSTFLRELSWNERLSKDVGQTIMNCQIKEWKAVLCNGQVMLKKLGSLLVNCCVSLDLSLLSGISCVTYKIRGSFNIVSRVQLFLLYCGCRTCVGGTAPCSFWDGMHLSLCEVFAEQASEHDTSLLWNLVGCTIYAMCYSFWNYLVWFGGILYKQ